MPDIESKKADIAHRDAWYIEVNLLAKSSDNKRYSAIFFPLVTNHIDSKAIDTVLIVWRQKGISARHLSINDILVEGNKLTSAKEACVDGD